MSEDPDAHTEISVPALKSKAPTTYIGRVIGERYRIVGPIGRGGAGNVYRGLQEPLGREVAVKILRPDLSGDSRVEWQARFLREAALAGRLSHPNVITVHDYGVTQDGASFVVMEFVKGRALAELIAGSRALDPARAANLVCQVARGLRAVHEEELIHRDVKPHNIMVVEQDGRERVVLLDFGLVKGVDMDDTDSYKTRVGTYMGTPAYMAPEQAKGGKVDHRVDLYALGCLLFRLLTGKMPFTAEHPLGMAVQHMTEPVPTFAAIAPDQAIPPRLEVITRRLLQKDPDRRYRHAADVVAELEKFLEDPPLPKAPPPPAAGAVGAGVGALGAGLGLMGVGMAVLAIFTALVVVLLFAQTIQRPIVDPVVPLPHIEPTVLLPTPEPVDRVVEPPPLAPAPTAPSPKPTPSPKVHPTPKPVEAAPSPTRPDPAPLPMPGLPSPKTTSAPRPVPVAAPQPKPSPPAPAPTNVALTIDEVGFTAAQAAKTLAFVNTATPEQLAAAHVYDKGVEIIVAKRPFASLEAFGKTYGIGKKTMRSVREGAR